MALRNIVQKLKRKKPVDSAESKVAVAQVGDGQVVEAVKPIEVLLVDNQELAIFGDSAAVDAYVSELSRNTDVSVVDFQSVRFDLIGGATNSVKTALEAGAANGRWIKLTEESARHIKLNGLIPTKDPGVSYVVVGQPGKFKHLVKAENISFFKNPMVLANASALVAQLAMSAELAAMKTMLKSIDAKVDDLREHNRDEQLAKLDRVNFAIDDAKIRAEHMGGKINDLTWSQIQGENRVIDEVQSVALRRLDSLLQKSKANGVKALAKELNTISQDASLWLTVLGRTLELREELAIIEVARTNELPFDEAVQHRASIRSALEKRRQSIRESASNFATELKMAAPVALDAVILHAVSSRKVVERLNQAIEVATKFETAFSAAESPTTIEPIHWVRAIRDPKQRKAAADQIVTPVIETIKDTVDSTKKTVKEIRDELKRPNDPAA